MKSALKFILLVSFSLSFVRKVDAVHQNVSSNECLIVTGITDDGRVTHIDYRIGVIGADGRITATEKTGRINVGSARHVYSLESEFRDVQAEVLGLDKPIPVTAIEESAEEKNERMAKMRAFKAKAKAIQSVQNGTAGPHELSLLTKREIECARKNPVKLKPTVGDK